VSTLWVQRVEPVSGDTYDVFLVGEDGQQRRVRCQVLVHHGIPSIRPDPDIFMTEPVDARLVARAVLAVHDARTGPGSGETPWHRSVGGTRDGRPWV
jgi:hypothetical protein